ncbi:hypothetical protein M501DRAFT_1032261 [Patellaria atrata CBS 101060]|uniref:F-box domain-containing protein n=1 Tax=Patellaria atrata CBS 101060 TaxID=1346257 RepID=A0A9P4VR02_9PEZI|nr:hypothetical protein M501DRAFT_1032261 [Patellaria atrata CBS 101060]
MIMDGLPIELIELIINELSVDDWRHLRLVNKTLAGLATRRLFEDFHMGLFDNGVRNLYNIGHHPELRNYVKSFSFYNDLLPKYISRDEWEAHIDLRIPFSKYYCGPSLEPRLGECGPAQDITKHLGYANFRADAREEYEKLLRHELTESELEQGWRQFSKYRSEQEHWFDGDNAMNFIVGLSKLNNLRHAAIKMSSGMIRHSYVPVWSRLAKEIYQEPVNFRRSRRAQVDTGPWSLMRVQNLSILLEAISQRALGSGVQHVEALRFSTVGDTFWMRLWDVEHHSNTPGHTEKVCLWNYSNNLKWSDAFSHLTSLFVVVEYCEGNDVETTAKALTLCLKSASHLQKLRLRWYHEDYVGRYADQPNHDILVYVEDFLWPKLRKLELEAMATDGRRLFAFLSRHSKSLRSLSFVDVELCEGTGTWENIIRRMPLRFTLDDILLEYLWDDTCKELEEGGRFFEGLEGIGYYEEMEEYCLHGGNFPIFNPQQWYSLTVLYNLFLQRLTLCSGWSTGRKQQYSRAIEKSPPIGTSIRSDLRTSK